MAERIGHFKKGDALTITGSLKPNAVEIRKRRHSGRDCRNPEAMDGKP
ncbi:MAG: hypothetical protein ACRERV_18230 [Methylococcales bacterium]